MYDIPERPPKAEIKSPNDSNNEGTDESDEEKKPKKKAVLQSMKHLQNYNNAMKAIEKENVLSQIEEE